METDTISHLLQLCFEGAQPRHTVPKLLAKWMIEALPDIQQVDRVLSVLEERVHEAGSLKHQRTKSSQMVGQDLRITAGAFELHMGQMTEAHHSFDADGDVLAQSALWIIHTRPRGLLPNY